MRDPPGASWTSTWLTPPRQSVRNVRPLASPARRCGGPARLPMIAGRCPIRSSRAIWRTVTQGPGQIDSSILSPSPLHPPPAKIVEDDDEGRPPPAPLAAPPPRPRPRSAARMAAAAPPGGRLDGPPPNNREPGRRPRLRRRGPLPPRALAAPPVPPRALAPPAVRPRALPPRRPPGSRPSLAPSALVPFARESEAQCTGPAPAPPGRPAGWPRLRAPAGWAAQSRRVAEDAPPSGESRRPPSVETAVAGGCAKPGPGAIRRVLTEPPGLTAHIQAEVEALGPRIHESHHPSGGLERPRHQQLFLDYVHATNHSDARPRRPESPWRRDAA